MGIWHGLASTSEFMLAISTVCKKENFFRPCKATLNLRTSLALLKLRFAPFEKQRQ